MLVLKEVIVATLCHLPAGRPDAAPLPLMAKFAVFANICKENVRNEVYALDKVEIDHHYPGRQAGSRECSPLLASKSLLMQHISG